MTKAVLKTGSQSFIAEIQRYKNNSSFKIETDALAVEEPLEIRIGTGKIHRAVSITMRTPGNDAELAAGFLFTEGILKSKNQITKIKFCGKFPNNRNTIRIDLQPNVEVNLKKLERNFYTTSSCGVCGKSSLDALNVGATKIIDKTSVKISANTIYTLSQKLRDAQFIFDETGGLHAAAVFDYAGNLISMREDVGRHNAVDKLIGGQFLQDNLPLENMILFLSGRASFELLQKAVMARIPVVCAVGAPSSLAVEAAREFNVTLLGFVRDGRFNIYHGVERISAADTKTL